MLQVNELHIQFEDIKTRLNSGGLSSTDKQFIESNYERVLLKTFKRSGCGECYKDAFLEMYIHFHKYGIKEMGVFVLKRGVALHTAGDCYTRVNMTDKIAAKLIKENPKRLDYFESYPKDAEKVINEILEVSPQHKRKRSKKQ